MKIHNKRAPASYHILEKFEAGIVLMGSEVKAIRAHHVDLAGSYVKIIASEAYLVNAKVIPYQFARLPNYDERRTRKLLLHKREIIALKGRLAQGGYTLVPLAIYTKNDMIKLELALVKGKKQHEKKRDLKEKDLERETELELKDAVKF